jgi:hypothetical protein
MARRSSSGFRLGLDDAFREEPRTGQSGSDADPMSGQIDRRHTFPERRDSSVIKRPPNWPGIGDGQDKTRRSLSKTLSVDQALLMLPPEVIDAIQRLKAACEDHVEFHRIYRECSESDKLYLLSGGSSSMFWSGLRSWLHRRMVKVRVPGSPANSNDIWRVVCGINDFTAICPKVRISKIALVDGKEVSSPEREIDLIYIFRGLEF